jgi:3-dehydroquinate dehydratase
LRQQVLELPAFVASLAPRNLADARRLVSLVPRGATAIEYRMDLSEEAIAPPALAELDSRPAIVTWRTVREGGGFQGSPGEYSAACQSAYDSGAIVDVEFSSGLLSERRAS